MPNRRQIMKVGFAGAASIASPLLLRRSGALAQPGTPAILDPTTIPKYVTQLFEVPAMPPSRVLPDRNEYAVAARAFTQQMLPAGFPATQVYGYGSLTDPRTFSTPARTFEERTFRPTVVNWVNQLVDGAGNYLPHMFPVDPTLHWANPPGGSTHRDMRMSFTSTPAPYRGPIPQVVHLHGQHAFADSDGFPTAWYLPTARNIPSGYARVGSTYERFRQEIAARARVQWAPGSAAFHYTNDQRATALWYHDHTLGMTRNNVYAGLAGMFMLRGGVDDLPPGVLPGPAPGIADPPGLRHYELPLVLQDKTFNQDGSLFFPPDRSSFGDTAGPFIPQTDIPPYWAPVFFANTIVVNGRTWPVLQVEPRRYRFRVLNASNVRGFNLRISSSATAAPPAPTALPIWVIGADGGFLPAPVSVQLAQIGVSERLDIIVDFTGLRTGTELYLRNEAGPQDPATTGQVMKFVVVGSRGPDRSVPPAQLSLPPRTPLGGATTTRHVSMNLRASQFQPDVAIEDLLGTVNADGTPNPLGWDAPVTENPRLGATEIWEMHNFHPVFHLIHLHQVQFEVLGRQPFAGVSSTPLPWETGTKDVLFTPSAATTRIKVKFDRAGLYVWHCHILDHEDNSMMRPLQVG
jgi:spore coat protein A, manganese oxidase